MANSTTTEPPNQPCSRNILITQQIIPVLYCVVFITGILLNGISGWVFFYVPSSKSFIIYLKNIVVADFLMGLTFPFKVLGDSGLGPWQVNVFVCRVSAVIFYVNMYVSIVFFGLISFDRYYKIVKPLLTSIVQSVNYSKLLSTAVWLLMLLLAVPNIILTNQSVKETTKIQCMQLKSELGRKWHKASNYAFVSIFWIVFLLLIIFYTAITRKIFKSHLKSRKNSISVKRKSSRNIFSIVLVFVVCFVPYHIARIPYTKSQTEAHYSCQSKETLLYVKEFTLLLSAANPKFLQHKLQDLHNEKQKAESHTEIFSDKTTAPSSLYFPEPLVIYLLCKEILPSTAFVSIDRCLQLTHSCKIYRIQEPGFAKMISTVVWLMVLLIMVPNMVIPIKDIKEKANCSSAFSPAGDRSPAEAVMDKSPLEMRVHMYASWEKTSWRINSQKSSTKFTNSTFSHSLLGSA
ncbi:hypothetical protein A6R68_01705, partial [Neotoma lepida]